LRICIIVNRHAGSAARIVEIENVAAEKHEVVWEQTNGARDAILLAEKAADAGFDVVAAAGGDGTVNEVVNGIMRSSHRPALGVVPLGTGNDLARMLAIPLEPEQSLALLMEGERRRLDLYEVVAPSENSYGINAAAGGFSGKVDEKLTPELKAGWGPLAYLISAATVASDIQAYEVRLSFDDEPPIIETVVNVIVANGRTLAGGRRAAPLSNPEDGLLDVIIVRRGTVVELGDAAARLVTGGFLNSRLVTHRRAHSLQLTSDPRMWFNVDGELLTSEPLSFHVVPGALDVVVGPGYEPDVQP
jgi:diacylglycerol kinase (ATP)